MNKKYTFFNYYFLHKLFIKIPRQNKIIKTNSELELIRLNILKFKLLNLKLKIKLFIK